MNRRGCRCVNTEKSQTQLEKELVEHLKSLPEFENFGEKLRELEAQKEHIEGKQYEQQLLKAFEDFVSLEVIFKSNS